MFSEIVKSDAKETKGTETQNFRDIKPESGMNVSEANKYWDNLFNGDTPSANEIGTEINEEPKQYFDDSGVKYREGNELEPNTKFERNSYTYETDEKGRVKSAEGKLQTKDHVGRNEMPDSRDVVAHGEMAYTDDRGHLIADRFNGSGELENLVPMEGKLNKGDYAKLEDTLAEAVKDGADVRLKVEPVYEGDAVRPTEFRVSYSIDGEKDVIVFKNRSGD